MSSAERNADLLTRAYRTYPAHDGACVRARTMESKVSRAKARSKPLGGLGISAIPITSEETVAVMDAVEVLGDTRQMGEITSVLYGDDAANRMGWSLSGPV